MENSLLYTEKVERKDFPQMSHERATFIAEMHRRNDFSLKATASQLSMSLRDFLKMITECYNLRTAIAHQKKLAGCYEPYGPKKGSYKYTKKDERDEN